jgi:hypothetical protein
MRPVGTQATSESSTRCMASASNDVSDTTRRALHIALCAVHLHIAWHSGVISGDAVMATLGQEIRIQTGGVECERTESVAGDRSAH